ncbi:MAG: TolC family protein [Melioribacteraceae bacterium]|nr:TolC family protein [Melioribacteraceae bacterium]MCF8263705.1 TolC family protein [Melioribacteraceae bacterium]MCF8413570.1 TolC family protein [Melioribacteraceae bacterium]MCF8432283.1 TolC family protein [Melioribacteraceae bacterium]
MKKALILILISHFTAAYAQEQNNPSFKGELLTINDAVKTAVEFNPGLNSLRENLNLAKSSYFKSFGIYSPNISYMKEGIDKTGDSFAERRWTISQKLDFPLKTIYNLNSISSEETAISYKIQSEEKALIADVKRSYVKLVYAYRKIELMDEQLRLSQKLHDAVKARTEVGVSSELDLLRAEIQKSEAENELENSYKNYHDTRYELFSIIGLDPEEQSYSTYFTDTLSYRAIEIDQEEAISRIKLQPEYLAMEAEQKSKNYKQSASWSSLLPDLEFRYYWQDYGSSYNFNGFEIGLNVPIWFVFNQQPEIEIAGIEVKKLEFQKREIYLRYKEVIEKTWHGYEASLKNMKRFEQNIQNKSSELLTLTTEGYSAGEISLFDLITAQQTYLRTRNNYFSALRDYYFQLIELEKYLDEELVY